MELPQLVSRFMQKKEEKQEFFLSLLLDIEGVVACLWHIDDRRMPVVTSWVTKHAGADSWDARLAAAEEAVSSLDVEADTRVDKVILGLPAIYLSEEGDIKKDVRPHLRKLTRALELTPLGFVSIHQALIHQLKREEGVPPTVILLGFSDGMMTVSIYKIGALVGQKTIATTDAVANLEEALRSFHDLEVLPSRILMYGTAEDHLEELKRDFLRHPWQTRANFMHFPKIDLLSNEKLAGAISLVGSSELATAMAADEPEEEVVVQQQEAKEEVAETKDEIPDREESNVRFVDPGMLGFKKSVDVLQEQAPGRHAHRGHGPQPIPEEFTVPKQSRISSFATLPRITLPSFPLASVRLPARSRLPIMAGAILIFVLLLFWGLYWFLPHASVTINEVPKKLTKSVAVSIDPTATVADPASKVLPGKKQEKTINGDKAIAVTGKKQVGDPAKGAITIYNKIIASSSSASLTLVKGTVFTNGDMQFTLDAAVTLPPASAVEFTKVNGGITASFIGAKGNLPAKTVFTVKGYDLSEVAAQNDQAFAGGTSRDVTIVTRADQDALVKSLTADLVEKAKQDLTGSVTGDDTLIDGTIKTSIVDKSFVEELDQEASNLHGKLTITVIGISYSKNDLASLVTGIIGTDIPAGYIFDPKNMKVSLGDVEVKKDGKITATADFDGTATPKLDLSTIASAIAGKSISSAQDYLKSIPGVGSVIVNVKISPWKNRLPANIKNISLSIAVAD